MKNRLITAAVLATALSATATAQPALANTTHPATTKHGIFKSADAVATTLKVNGQDSSQLVHIAGQPSPLTATITPAEATGTVEFFSDGQSVGTAPVNGGTATLNTSLLTGGLHAITAQFTPANPQEYATSTATGSGYRVVDMTPAVAKPAQGTTAANLTAGTLTWLINNYEYYGTTAKKEVLQG